MVNKGAQGIHHKRLHARSIHKPKLYRVCIRIELRQSNHTFDVNSKSPSAVKKKLPTADKHASILHGASSEASDVSFT